jgi:hypothetical protein
MKRHTCVAVLFSVGMAAMPTLAQQAGPSGSASQATGAAPGAGAAGSAPTITPNAPQGGTHLDGTVTPGPNIGISASQMPPTTPGVGRSEGAQPGQSGSAGAIRQRSPAASSSGTNFGGSPTPGFQPQQQGIQRPPLDANAQPTADPTFRSNSGVSRPPVFSRQRAFAPTWANQRQRDLLLNDLRANGHLADEWRVLQQDGRWWYYTPDESWLVYDNQQRWTAYRPQVETGAPSNARPTVIFPSNYPREDWRLVFHQGRWWFWTPEATWLYQERGRWVDYNQVREDIARAATLDRRSVGYRGEVGGHFDGVPARQDAPAAVVPSAGTPEPVLDTVPEHMETTPPAESLPDSAVDPTNHLLNTTTP